MVIVTAFVGSPEDGRSPGAGEPCDDWRASVVSGRLPPARAGDAQAGTGFPSFGFGRTDAPIATRRLRRLRFVDR